MEKYLYKLYDITNAEYIKPILLIITILLILFIIFVLPSIVNWWKIYLRAQRDYQLSRGTQHLKLIQSSLKFLEKDLENLEKRKYTLKNDIEKLKKDRSDRLLIALSRHLVETRLIEVEGIGPKLRDLIISRCFDGTLQSLQNAYNVYGIGMDKMLAITSWVKKYEREIPYLLNKGFPEKNKIIKEFDSKETQLKKHLIEIEEKINWMKDIKKQADAEKDRLMKVRVSHFRKSIFMDKEASEVVTKYIQGTFPEWAPMPEWSKTLISNFSN